MYLDFGPNVGTFLSLKVYIEVGSKPNLNIKHRSTKKKKKKKKNREHRLVTYGIFIIEYI